MKVNFGLSVPLVAKLVVLVGLGVLPLHAGDDSLNFDELIGLTVDVETSENCGGLNNQVQHVTNSARISGGGGCPVKLAITVTGSVETQDAPFDYVYVNDVLFFSGEDEDGECAMTTKTVTKIVTVNPDEDVVLLYDTSDALYHVGAYATITNVEVVEDSCSSGCAAGGASMQNGSVHVAFNLGKAAFGQSVGALRIEESSPSNLLGTPASLHYSSAWEGVEIIRDSSSSIRQVKAPQCLADVVTESAHKFRVDFYDPANMGVFSNGVYDQSGKSPYVSWILENVDPVNNGHLKITQVRGSLSVLNEFIWDAAAQGWELREGNGFRKEKKSVVSDAANGTRTVTSEVRNFANALVSKEVATYKEFPWGKKLIQNVVDPGGAALTTTHEFYDNAAADGGAYGKLKSTIRSDGGWVKYEYDVDGRMIKMVEPFLDASPGSPENLCKVTSITYQNVIPQETRVVTVLGQEVGRSYKAASNDYNHVAEEVECVVAGAAYGDPTNLVTATKLVDSGEFVGEVEWVSNSDGTGETYEYSKTSTQKTVTVRRGEMSANQVISGTATTTIMDVAGNLLSEMVVDIASGLTVSLKTVPSSDVFGRPAVFDYNDGTSETINYGCCGIDSQTDREGITTYYTYDAFKRVSTESRAGVTTAYTYDAMGRLLTRKRIGSDNSEVVQEANTYDMAGRRTHSRDALLQETTWTWSTDASGRSTETVTNPDGGVVNTITHRDGKIYEVSGSGTFPQRRLYGVEAGNGYFEKEIHLGSSGEVQEWTQSWEDLAGRVVRTQHNGMSPATRHYDSLGKLAKTVDPDGVVVLYTSNGNSSSVILDADRDGVASAADRIESTTREVVSAHGFVVKRTEQHLINAAGDDELVAQSDVSADGLRLWNSRFGQNSSFLTTYGPAGVRSETVTYPDGSTETKSYAQDRLISESRAAAGGSPVLKSVSYTYDPHGRRLTSTDARNGTTTHGYDAMDRMTTVTTPAPGAGQAAQTTAHAYDPMGRETVTTLPDGSQTTNEWFLDGRLKKRSGSQEPTVSYTYDSQGRVKTLTTTGQAGPATTTWAYEATTGRLGTKTYPNGDTISYTYTSAGRTLTRTTGRGVTRTYGYDLAGRSTGIDYSDATPDVSYTLNRLGQTVGITDGLGTRTRTVATDGRLLGENRTSGLLSGASIGYGYDSLLRRQTFSAAINGASFETGWSYDGVSRLETVTSGADSTTYSYAPNSGLITGVSTVHGGVTSLSTTSSYDALNRLTSISSSSNGVVVSSHAYAYDSLNRRTGSVLEDGKKWEYGYDAMGQVVSGKKATASNQAVPGMDFGYAFDGIGNRTAATVNGRTGTYTANASNQYTQRQVPGALDIRGRASSSATVTVNTEATQRLDDYFYKALAVDNGSSPQYPAISVLAVLNLAGPNGEDLQSQTTGHLFLPQNPEIFTYDAEGNLTQDGRWIYVWDGENRLIRMETNANVPNAAKRKLEFAYDAESRRTRKQVSLWDGSAWNLLSDRRYLYDGWNLAAELDATNIMVRDFVWGLDLSRSPQGAGGVGGLLSLREGAESHLPCYDGNGNVMALVKASDRTVSARYEYGPFGESLVVEEKGVSNPFRFSSKFFDSESGLLYYGYRFYNAFSGSWVSRDPIEERGGYGLYGFLNNGPISRFDILGKCWGKARAVSQYEFALGDVNLDDTGCTQIVYSNFPKQRSDWEDIARADCQAKMASMVSGKEYIAKFDNVGASSGVWWIGGWSVRRYYRCLVDKDKCKYNCRITYSMADTFEDPLDFDNTRGRDFWDHWETGFPFTVSHVWIEKYPNKL